MTAAELDTYLQRIGHTGPCAADLETLAAVHHAHACAIAFENLDPWLGIPLKLDADSLQEKLVRSARGGFCYEQNLLLADALRTIGFAPVRLAARVLWNVPAETTRPRTHMLLMLDIDGNRYLVDAGFGGQTLTGPLRMDLVTPQLTPHGRFRLLGAQSTWVLQAEAGSTWKTMYTFDLQPQQLPDYELPCWYLCHHPESLFVQTLIAARPVAGGRQVLRNRELTLHGLDGKQHKRVLGSAGELREVLSEVFGIDTSALAELDQRFESLPAPAEPAP